MGCKWQDVQSEGHKRSFWDVVQYEYWSEEGQQWVAQMPEACMVKGEEPARRCVRLQIMCEVAWLSESGHASGLPQNSRMPACMSAGRPWAVLGVSAITLCKPTASHSSSSFYFLAKMCENCLP